MAPTRRRRATASKCHEAHRPSVAVAARARGRRWCAGHDIREFHTLEVKEKKEGKAYASYYLVGVLEGLREASDTARRTGQKPLFCVEGRRLEPSMARSLFQAELKRNAELYEADMPVQLVLSSALQNSFPVRVLIPPCSTS
jgi:enoyl-CoA hydratase/carnithine racemase